MSDSSKNKEASVAYEEVAYSSEGANVFAPTSSRFGSRFQMGVFLLAGVVLMLAHHFFYNSLDGKAVDSQLFIVRGFSLSDQSVSSILGNAVAYAARTVLSAGIGVVFIQVLWSKLRREQFSVKQIDSLVAASKGSPFTVSSIPTWRYAFWLAAIAAMATLMSLISIIAPGSLRVESFEFSTPRDCSVRTVSLNTANIVSYTAGSNASSSNSDMVFNGAQARLMAIASQVLMGGAALQPVNDCNGACQYEINFLAPVATCNPVDSSFDFSSWLPAPANDTAPVNVWTAKYAGLWTVVATRDLNTNTQSAVNCTTFNATYHAFVTHTNTTSSTVDVYQTDLHNEFFSVVQSPLGSQSQQDYTSAQYDALFTAFADTLAGGVNYNPVTQEYSPNDNFFVAYSSLFTSPGTSKYAWAAASNLSTLLPSFMRNLSVSMLSDILSSTTNSTTAPFDTTCWFTSSAYSYNRTRLLATYGAAIGITAICMLFGFYAIHTNGVEESVAFSRIMGSILNKPLFDDRYELSRSSKLTANGSPDGQLKLVPTTYGPI
ncbi:hypothetical protein SCHPADRAFT_890628 [Schizopora paradoxa]|uniref:Uncharacterized protein n=1 Tax=Schizopora paradoxa TaxID=27342 RepID=A0A0H2RT90_9AGAM|nr:hypothetical protein SCHPADRAFT_890628 [Schizopora paradoxa]